MELLLFIGLQAAGKSTLYQRRFAATHTLVSKDLLRNNRRPGGRQAQLIGEALAAGRSVVVDNTNPTLADRAQLIALGHAYGARVVGYVFASTVRDSLARNAQRTGRARVPDVAIYATAKRFVAPSYAEGFDALYAVHIDGEGGFQIEAIPHEQVEGSDPMTHEPNTHEANKPAGAEQWDDPQFAEQWDQSADIGNPARAQQVAALAAIVGALYQPDATILDLGIGSGQVEVALFARRPDAQVVGVEASSAMIALAERRLAPFAGRYQIVRHDLGEIATLRLPERRYQLALSVQTLHHLSHAAQRTVYAFLAATLPTGGVFLLVDRLTLHPERFSALYRPLWEQLEREASQQSGWSADAYLQRVAGKDDSTATLEEHLAWLRAAGFDATCLSLSLDRALIAAVKR